MSSFDPNHLVNIYSHYDKTTFDPPPAIAGSPYSCGVDLNNELYCLNTRNETFLGTKEGPASKVPLFTGKSYLSSIFVKIDSILKWNASIGNYGQKKDMRDDLLDQSSYPYNFSGRATYTNTSRAPAIHPLGTCKPGGKCLETNTAGFTLNGKSSGDLIFPNSVAAVNLKFFAFGA